MALAEKSQHVTPAIVLLFAGTNGPSAASGASHGVAPRHGGPAPATTLS